MLRTLESQIKACQICSQHLPLGPKPIVKLHQDAKIVIISQAPGRIAHSSGVPFMDQSGIRLRTWLGVDETTFYDSSIFAIMPMGFCYPGKGKVGDLPPRKECAPEWHAKALAAMPNLKLHLLIGQYSQKYYLKKERKKSLTATVQAFREYPEHILPLPHPSPLNVGWLRKNPWFEAEVVPYLQERVRLHLER